MGSFRSTCSLLRRRLLDAAARCSAWSREAALLGVQLWARRLDGHRGDPLERAQAFCRNVIQQETVQLGRGGQCGAMAQSAQLDIAAPEK
ncbi:MAG: hypothetical protein PHD58_09180 [Anaerolineales bacterium]|nr:hypothetical protein [Anaerolineales bacterium]